MSHFSSNSSVSKSGALYLYGRHPVTAAINNPNRQISVLYATKDTYPETAELCRRAQRPSSLIKLVDRKEIEKLLPAEAVHQGFAAQVKPLDSVSLEEICAAADQYESCHLLILDQVTDPQNIGAIIRSCVAFNALALIVQDKNSPIESGAMAKASAGMIELLPIVRVTNLARALETLKKSGFWIIGMDGYAKTTIDKMNKSGKTAIIMGSEGKGMRRLIEESCDSTVRLPISEKVESLNVSTAAAITLYELNKR
ncbi:MAG: 23S rRNA (guanosine(2251)-2'-O)-methyltransferase RlmB [Alphaproteobacteria bacterium]|nr:23S rRNA (guanosine(2251)-2'-O)-methyltransferase RlmB [Alphaproteobacteria bacterium]